MHPEGLSHARTEAIRLYECTNQCADVVNPGSVDKISQGLSTRLTRTHFEVYEMEFVTEVGMGMVQVLTDAHQGLIERQAGLDANDGKVEGVGQSQTDTILPITNHALQDEAGQEEAQCRNPDQKRKVVKSEPESDAQKSYGGHENTAPK